MADRDDPHGHLLRVIYGRAVQAAAELVHTRMEAFRRRADPAHQLVPWAALSTDHQNAYRAAVADLAGRAELARLQAAAELMRRG